ncbi:MAG: hypothetical protein ACOC7L_03055, partial [Acidobacteriota bacterium]
LLQIAPAAALALLLAATFAPPARAGLYFEQTVTSQGAGEGMEMQVRGWADGEKARVEYTESNNPILSPGSYLLTTDGGETVLLVDPEEKTYSTWDFSAAFRTLGQLEEMTGGMMKIDFQDPVSETLLTEPGEEILGYPTTHHRWKSGFTLQMKMGFVDRSQRQETITDAWVTDAVDDPGLFAWLRAMPPTTGDPELDEHLASEMRQLGGNIVLRMVQETTTTNKKGRERTSTTSFEVTTFREEPVDAERFAMPEGYTETPLVPEGGGR